ncbi:MAG TPA: 1-(5-phosphoribosyl)-5-[(5-phosphoribosylamino)methylideneamino]imidazole-4-carboxamide isomerase [Tepidisphaeraceae bacterium]|nr:1-(5-phosphoribosyl)-5-[(5-phosphoribosylamino)methylideneamino]imidazole-4-carboxamide isomerase [Tepidisphaeraceae bacterium]
MALEVIPSIDLREGRVVRLAQGDYGRQTNYDVDPIETARLFAEAGAKWMHIVDLDGAKSGRPVQADLIAKIIKSTSLKVEVGGGVRSTEDVRQLLATGAKRVVVGTKAIEDWAWFETLAKQEGLAKQLILALDAKEGMVATRGWTQTSDRSAVDVAKQVSGWDLGAILYTDVAKDGMLQGPNLRHTRLLAEAGDTPVIASGGVGSIDHIKALKAIPIIWGVIVGRSLYEGKVNLAEAIQVSRA